MEVQQPSANKIKRILFAVPKAHKRLNVRISKICIFSFFFKLG